MLHRIAHLAIAAPCRIVAGAVLFMIAATVFGVPVAGHLSAGGFQDPTSESARAAAVLTEKFHQGDMRMLITVTTTGGVTSASARTVATGIVEHLRASPWVADVTSPWTDPPQSVTNLVSKDGRTGLVVVGLNGGENDGPRYARQLADETVRDRDGVTVRAGGIAIMYAEIIEQTRRDLIVMEAFAIPLSFVALVWVFGGLVAAAIPLAVGLMAIVASMAALRAVTLVTDVSIFALNLSAALGFALAIDYTLLLVSRFRDEISGGADRDGAVRRTLATAGRTVVFSATTVALAMAALTLFPMYFLKSFAYAGIATVGFAAIAALLITPAAIVLAGYRLDTLDVRHLARRLLRRPALGSPPSEELFWYRSTQFVIRHAVPIALASVALLVLLGLPFLGVRWGFPDDRVLPRSASAHQVGDQLRRDFPSDLDTGVTVVIPDLDAANTPELERYATDLSRVADVVAVSAPTGTFVGGRRTGPPSAATGMANGSVFLTVASSAPLFSERSEAQLDALHAVPGPAGRGVKFSGSAQVNRDTLNGMASRLPLVLGLTATVTLLLLFLLTGSVLLPLKALLLNMLSLTATFGALVWVFQSGHLGAFGTTPNGTLALNVPVMLFCLAFGLSMDYEVFLVSRIHEYWLGSARTTADNDECVALGLARTGRVVTAAALIMSIAFAGLIAGQVSFLRMFGVGLALAVVMDTTLVRMVLMPSFMHILGRWNWWAPRHLALLHARIGVAETARSL